LPRVVDTAAGGWTRVIRTTTNLDRLVRRHLPTFPLTGEPRRMPEPLSSYRLLSGGEESNLEQRWRAGLDVIDLRDGLDGECAERMLGVSVVSSRHPQPRLDDAYSPRRATSVH